MRTSCCRHSGNSPLELLHGEVVCTYFFLNTLFFNLAIQNAKAESHRQKILRDLPLYKDKYAAGWKKNLDTKVISYFIHSEINQDTLGLENDLKIALLVWFKLLNLQDIKIVKAEQKKDANFVIHIGKNAVANRVRIIDHPAHTYFILNWFRQFFVFRCHHRRPAYPHLGPNGPLI